MIVFLLFWFLLLCEFRPITSQNPNYYLSPNSDRYKMAKLQFESASDLIIHQNKKLNNISRIRQANSVSAAYEIGYMIQMIQEHYRRMLDKWRSTRIDVTKLYTLEVTLYLEEIEHLYWAIKHEVYMLHEIERKYKIYSEIDESYEDPQNPKPPKGQDPEIDISLGGSINKTIKYINMEKFLQKKQKEIEAEKEKVLGQKGANGPGTPGGTTLGPKWRPAAIFGPYTTLRPSKTDLPLAYGWDLYEWNSNT